MVNKMHLSGLTTEFHLVGGVNIEASRILRSLAVRSTQEQSKKRLDCQRRKRAAQQLPATIDVL